MDDERAAGVIGRIIAPHADATAAYEASGLHPAHPADPARGDGPRRLLLAARDAFFTAGYAGASTRDLAAEAGMSPTAMYAHYASKQELLLRLCVLGNGAALEALVAASAGAATPHRRLRAAVFAFARWHAENHRIGRVVQWELAALSPDNYAVVAAQRRSIDAELRGILIDGVASGDFVIADLPGTTLAILSLCIDIVRWFPSRTIHAPDAIAATYAALADAMVSSAPGAAPAA